MAEEETVGWARVGDSTVALCYTTHGTTRQLVRLDVQTGRTGLWLCLRDGDRPRQTWAQVGPGERRTLWAPPDRAPEEQEVDEDGTVTWRGLDLDLGSLPAEP